MTYISYPLAGAAELIRDLFCAALAAAAAGAACCGACYAIRTGWRRAAPAGRQRRHAEAALHAQVARGLADIERYLRARSAGAARPADSDPGRPLNDPELPARHCPSCPARSAQYGRDTFACAPSCSLRRVA